MFIPAGTTVSIQNTGVTAPANPSNRWEVYHNGTLVGSSTTPNGWNVAPTVGMAGWYDVSVPITESPSVTDTEYQFRFDTSVIAVPAGGG